MTYYDKFIEALSNGKNLRVIPGSSLEGITPESNELSVLADDISEVMIKEIGFYRNTVLPTVKRTFKQFEGRVKTVKEQAFGGGETIVSVGIPIPADEDFSFRESIGYMDYDNISLISKTGEAVRELTNNTSFIDTISDNKLAHVWDKYFTTFGNDNSNIIKATATPLLNTESVNDIFIIYYILKGMMGKDYIDGNAGSLDNFRSNREAYYNYIKQNIAKRIEMLKKSVRNGEVIISRNPEKNRITIVEDMYKPFIEAGGTNDMLYGSIRTETLITNVDILVSNKIVLEKAYKDNHAARMAKVNSNILQITNDGLLAMITNMVSSVPEENRNDTYDIIKEYILGLDTSSLGSPITVIEDIYSDIIYKDTNLKEFLRLVRMYTEHNTVKHAITLTIAHMVSSYLLNGVEVLEGE